MNSLFSQRLKVDKINLSFGKIIEATLTFDNGSIFSTQKQDAVEYVQSLKQGIDDDGDYVFRPVKNTEKYFDEEIFLLRNHTEKVAAATHDLANGKTKFAYNLDDLQEEFLASMKRSDKKFLPLKQDYFGIAAYRLNEAAAILRLHTKHLKNSPEYEDFFKAACNILATAFRNDANFMKNFANRNKKVKLDLLESINKYASALQGVQDVRPLFSSGGLKADTGIHLVLDAYRKYAEACVRPLNFLRIAYELNNGEISPKKDKKAQDNKAILSLEMGSMLNSFNPHLRNSESHLNTRFSHKDHRLLISDTGGYSQEYTYKDIIDMTNDLANNLLPALMVSLIMESQLVTLVLSTQSHQYISALLRIDNT